MTNQINHIPKVPFEILFLEVEKLYQKQFPPGAYKAIEEHCEYISQFIEACGWSIDQYQERCYSNKNQV